MSSNLLPCPFGFSSLQGQFDPTVPAATDSGVLQSISWEALEHLLRTHNCKHSLDLLALGARYTNNFCFLSVFPLKQSCSMCNKQHQPQLAAVYHQSSTQEMGCQRNPCPTQAVDLCDTSCEGSSCSSSALVSYYNGFCTY